MNTPIQLIKINGTVKDPTELEHALEHMTRPDFDDYESLEPLALENIRRTTDLELIADHASIAVRNFLVIQYSQYANGVVVSGTTIGGDLKIPQLCWQSNNAVLSIARQPGGNSQDAYYTFSGAPTFKHLEV